MVESTRRARAGSGVLAVVLLGLCVAFALRWYFDPTRLSGKSTINRSLLLVQTRLEGVASPATIALARARAKDDDWSTFAHDDLRSGLQRTPTGITKATVGQLQRRWLRQLHERVWSSPLAVGGLLYLATDQGTVYALDAATGEVRWHRKVGNAVRMTPALVGGRLLVGTYGRVGVPGQKPRGASFEALDPVTGALLWRTPLPGLVRSEPVVLNGTIYEGLAGGDPFSGCSQGRIVALDERTGKLMGTHWESTRKADNGGGVWGPLSTDGEHIYVGTGNTCRDLGAAEYGDSIVALSRDLHLLWHVSTRIPGVDDSDVGGGVALQGDHAFVAAKNGYLYMLDRATGRVLRITDLAPWARNGGSIGTPTGDGTMLMISGGERTNPDLGMKGPRSVVTAFDPDGRELYHFTSDNVVTGYVAFVPGVGFVAVDRHLIAFDTHTGEQLWSADTGDGAYPSPVVVPSGVYIVNNIGDVQAFGLSAEATPDLTRR